MTIQEGIDLLGQQVTETGIIQWVAVLLAVAEVLLAQQNRIALYPTGIAATTLSVFILFEAGLYAESLLNCYYIVMSVYGWWYWVKKKDRKEVKINTCNARDWLTVTLIVGLGFGLMSVILKYYTPSTVPLMDAWIAATAWAGMWLLAKRKIENWTLLNISNLFAIPLLFYKGLPLYGMLTVFLFVVAIFGHFKWKQILIAEKAMA